MSELPQAFEYVLNWKNKFNPCPCRILLATSKLIFSNLPLSLSLCLFPLRLKVCYWGNNWARSSHGHGNSSFINSACHHLRTFYDRTKLHKCWLRERTDMIMRCSQALTKQIVCENWCELSMLSNVDVRGLPHIMN